MGIVTWFLEKTKVGQFVKKTQDFLDGKKQLLTGIATAIPASVAVVQNFSAGGMDYLLHASKSPEFAAAALGWGLIFNAFKGEKTRQEIADLHDTIKAQQAAPADQPQAPQQGQ